MTLVPESFGALIWSQNPLVLWFCQNTSFSFSPSHLLSHLGNFLSGFPLLKLNFFVVGEFRSRGRISGRNLALASWSKKKKKVWYFKLQQQRPAQHSESKDSERLHLQEKNSIHTLAYVCVPGLNSHDVPDVPCPIFLVPWGTGQCCATSFLTSSCHAALSLNIYIPPPFICGYFIHDSY